MEALAAVEDSGERVKMPRRRLRREIKWAVYVFVLLLALEFVVLPRLGGFGNALRQVGHLNLAFVAAGILLEAAALMAYAELTRTVLPPNGPNRWRLLRIDLSSLALTHVVPGGTAPGSVLAYRLLTQSNVRPADVGFALAMQGVGSALVLNALFWGSLVVSLFLHPYSPLYTLAGGAGVLMMAVVAAAVVALTRGRHRTIDAARRLADWLPFLDGDRLAEGVQRVADRLRTLAQDRRLLGRAVAWAAANWLFDAASLWVFIAAFHHYLSPIDLLVAYGLAQIVAVIPITPGGLGFVEGVLAPTLIGFHVPAAIAGPAILGYRLVNFWLPIPVGGLAYMSLRFTGEGWRQRFAAVREEVVVRPDGTTDPTGPEARDPEADDPEARDPEARDPAAEGTSTDTTAPAPDWAPEEDPGPDDPEIGAVTDLEGRPPSG